MIQRFPGWLRRYWAFALPWILVMAIGPLREPFLLHVFGSPVVPSGGSLWVWQFQAGSALAPPSESASEDFDSQVWQIWARTQVANGSDTTAMADRLMSRYPRVRWLPAFCVWCGWHNEWDWEWHSPARLKALCSRAVELEPDNAFPQALLWECQMMWHARTHSIAPYYSGKHVPDKTDDDYLSGLLHTAVSKFSYDDHLTDAMACILRANGKAHLLAPEEKIWMLSRIDDDSPTVSQYVTTGARQAAGEYQARGDFNTSLQICADVGRLGTLMASGRNCLSVLEHSNRYVGELHFWNGTFSFCPTGVSSLPDCAQSLNLPTAARWIREAFAKQKDIVAWGRKRGTHYAIDFGSYSWLWRLRNLNVGVILVHQTVLVAVVWLFAACLFWVDIPPASSTADRASVALGCAIVSGCLGAYCSFHLDPNGGYTPHWQQDAWRWLALLAFAAPIPYAWTSCALQTFMRDPDAFQRSGMSGTELGLSGLNDRLVRLTSRSALWFCLLLLPVAALGWWQIVERNEAARNPHSFGAPAPLPFGPGVVHGATMAMIYGAILLVFGCVFWMGNWRWTRTPVTREATRGAVRWWKESLGAYLVLLSWLYLIIAVIHIPVRREADAQVERVLRNGEIGALYEMKP